ncbi:uncharacterized protein LOC125419026 isoform X2 [Ziziphus jujuba]|uniref:Uncharacterized protein LOC125419026 isoform X2 n=1 Tax=Ziziphus jujuba TaxID=326968 RepID=A0ABM3I3G3_ZIZJJ|nr:uncharacterized protein LOC125419026 isoform X2 [Ziziphus jujuba]
MAVVLSINWQRGVVGVVAESQFRCRSQSQSQFQSQNPSFSNSNSLHFRPIQNLARRRSLVNGFHGSSEPDPKREQDEEVNNLGVKAALSVLKFYKTQGKFHQFCRRVVDMFQVAVSIPWKLTRNMDLLRVPY